MSAYMCLVPHKELRDLVDLARCAAQQVRLHEGDNPLSSAIDGAVASVEVELSMDDALVLT